MRRAGFSFLTTWVMVSLTVNFVAAPTPVLSTPEGPTPTSVPPVSSQMLQFVADHIEADAAALLRLIPSAQVKWRD